MSNWKRCPDGFMHSWGRAGSVEICGQCGQTRAADNDPALARLIAYNERDDATVAQLKEAIRQHLGQ